jgi:hypothetical protein
VPIWVIQCFWNERRGIFEKEYRDQTPEARAEFRATLNLLRDSATIEGWCRPAFDRLSGKYRQLGKLRFKANGAQHRPLGFFGPGTQAFTLLAWATERDGRYWPPGIRDSALDRMKRILEDPTRAHEFDF